MAASTMPIAGSAEAVVSPFSRPAKLPEKTPQAESPSYRASPRTIKVTESNRRQQVDDDDMSPADEDDKQLHNVSTRLPGIAHLAHLDRRIHSPCNALPPPRLIGRSVGEQHYSYGGYRGGRTTSLPRSLSTSLLSMPSSNPRKAAHSSGGAEAACYDNEHVNDKGRVHGRAGVAPYSRHKGSIATSTRHHPYAMPSQHNSHHRGAFSTECADSSYLDDLSIAGDGADSATSGNVNDGSVSPESMQHKRGKLPELVTDLLKTWLLDHAAYPYPTVDEKRRLCAATGLSISQVSNWFINGRRRILVPQGSRRFRVAPSSIGIGPAAAAAARGPDDNPSSAAKRHSPSGFMLASYHLGRASGPPPAQHHQWYLRRPSHPFSAYKGSDMLRYSPQYSHLHHHQQQPQHQHHQHQHQHQRQHHSYPSPPSTRPFSGLPLVS